MSSAAAFCPASISFLFKVCPSVNLSRMGSVGLGCTIDKGVKVRVKPLSKSVILFNGKTIRLPTVSSVLTLLAVRPVMIDIVSELPLGYGFGISGASALACAFAVNKLFKLKKNNFQLATIAHMAEITNQTGLGSVGTQFTGGFLWKTAPGIPVQGKPLPFVGKKIYALILDKLETPSVLKDGKKIQKINIAADSILRRLKMSNILTLDQIFDFSYAFARKSTLLSDKLMINTIESIKASGGHATMNMLGKVILSTSKPYISKDYQWEIFTITNSKVHSL